MNNKLDEILLTFAKRVESMRAGKTYGWDIERAEIIKWIEEEIIGPDKPPALLQGAFFSEYNLADLVNAHLAKQRQRLHQGEDNPISREVSQ